MNPAAQKSNFATNLEQQASRKLEEGLNRLAQAGQSPELLGSALVALHGALEDAVRARLSRNRKIPNERRSLVSDLRRVQWLDLLKLLDEFEGMDQISQNLIRRANDVRQEFAHGGECEWNKNQVQKYGDFVERLIRAKSGRVATSGLQGMQGAEASVQAAIEMKDPYWRQSYLQKAADAALSQGDPSTVIQAATEMEEPYWKQSYLQKAADCPRATHRW